jgi:hypothetical protein
MGDQDEHTWRLARQQHDVVTRPQLLALGYTPKAIKHRVRRGWLHPLWPGVYAVGSPNVTRVALWMGAVLACGEGAALSHRSAGGLWVLVPKARGDIHVSVPISKNPKGAGIAVHRRRSVFDVTTYRGIPVTTPACTIVDMAPDLTRDELERVINEADIRRLVTVPALSAAVQELSPRPGLSKVKRTIDLRTFTYTRSGLERAFIPIAVRAGMPRPETLVYVNGYEVDFYFRELGIVVETDGGTFHRTPAQQTADRRRDQTHLAAGLTPLRFTHGQIKYEPAWVEQILRELAARAKLMPPDRYMSSIVSASSPTSRNSV